MTRRETDDAIYDQAEHPQPKSLAQLIAPRGVPLARPTAGRGQSERAALVGFFCDRLNDARKGTKFKPLTYRAVGVKLAHLSIFELYAFQKLCLNAEKRGTPFSRVFFGSLKVPRGEEAKAGTGSRHPEAH